MKKIVISLQDFVILQLYCTRNLLRFLMLVLRRGPWIIQDIRRYPWILTLARVNSLLRRLVKNRRGRYRLAIILMISSVVKGVLEILGGVFFHSERLVLHEDMVPPEILHAMGLKTWMLEMLGILLPMIDPHAMEKYIDVCENNGVPPDVCSLPKSTMGLVQSSRIPPGRACVTSNLPCDGGMASYTVIEKHFDIPVYRLDIPHHFYSDRAEEYFSGELRGMVEWLEENTPGTMDWQKLKDILEKRNRMAEYELELWDMMSRRPAPLAAEAVYLSHLWSFNVTPGQDETLELYRKLINLTEQNIRENIQAVPGEKYRAILWNPPLLHFIDIFQWAERAYGVSLIIDSMTYNNQSFIDTSSQDAMLKGLGSIIMQGPMARHTRGPAENYLEDMFIMCKRFDIDMIWVASHIGCKNTAAMNGILRERCRKEGIPLLTIDYDLSDPRIESHEGITSQVENFMETIMKAEKLDKSA